MIRHTSQFEEPREIVFYKGTTGSWVTEMDQLFRASSTVTPKPSTMLSDKLVAVGQEVYSNYAAQKLASFAGWSYSDHETFKGKIADEVGQNIETIMIQVKNKPMLVQV